MAGTKRAQNALALKCIDQELGLSPEDKLSSGMVGISTLTH